MTRQDQRVGEGGQAIQASRDVNISHGMTPEQMLTIMEGVATQVQRGVDRAAALVEVRLDEFRQAVVEEFSKPEAAGRTDAFQDPDFQFALHEAQKGFARSGAAELKDELVRLLSQRAAEPDRNRASLILNEAIQAIGSLTRQEIAVLALIFLLHHVQVTNASMSSIARYYNELISPFINDLPDDDFAYDYLGSMKCTITNQVSNTNIWEILRERYESAFSRGFARSEIPTGIPESQVGEFIQRVPSSFDERFRFSPRNRSELEKAFASAGINSEIQTAYFVLYDARKLSDDEFKQFFTEQVPVLGPLIARWDKTMAKSTHLTGLGKAIAHSVLSSRTTFSAPLEIWVK